MAAEQAGESETEAPVSAEELSETDKQALRNFVESIANTSMQGLSAAERDTLVATMTASRANEAFTNKNTQLVEHDGDVRCR